MSCDIAAVPADCARRTVGPILQKLQSRRLTQGLSRVLRLLRSAMTRLLSALIACLVAAPVWAAQPNFVIINVDDLGYGDISPYGSKNATPQLDRMAREGRKLTSHYAAPVCSPSRAALMTGCYPKRGLPIPGVLFPAGAVGLNAREVTIAEVLKDAGYATACIGK